MFVRIKKTPLSKKTAVQLVENTRKNGKVSQKIIRHFGYAINDEEIQALKRIAERYKLELINQSQPLLFSCDTIMDMLVEKVSKEQKISEALIVDLTQIREEKRLKVGIHQIYGNLFDVIGFHKCIDKWYRKKATLRLMRNIVMARIERPQSKRGSVQNLSDQYGIDAEVNSVYRMMDLIDDKAINKINQLAYNNTSSLFETPVDVVFYDCTTLYFESFVEDDLKIKGYSKDGKFNESQVILALMVTQCGLPLGYEVFPGNSFEGDTLDQALDKLKNKYKIGKVIFVADSALLSRKNIEKLNLARQKFIVGARIKNMNKQVTQKILNKQAYQKISNKADSKDQTNDELSYQTIDIKKEQIALKLIVSHSTRRERKDEHDRQKAIDSLKKKIEKDQSLKGLVNNYGYKKYIQVDGESKYRIDKEKIEQDARWDGLHGVITNIENPNVNNILSQYKGLWQVEETFRVSKHDMKVRPIYHWVPRRIKAHIALCFMALTCIRTLEYQIRLQYKKLSPEVIRYHLSKVEVSILKDLKTKKKYVLPSTITQEAKKIYQTQGIKHQEVPFDLK